MNRCIFSGNITRDADLRFTPQGTPVCSFSLAVRDYRAKDDKTLFIKVNLWGKSAEKINLMLVKGQAVITDGRLEVWKNTDKEGKEWTNLTLHTNEVELIGPKKGPENAPAAEPVEEVDK